MKTCNVCKVEKPLSCFGKDSTRVDGLKYKCKQCRKKLAKNSKANKYWKVNNWSKVLEVQCQKRAKEKGQVSEITEEFIKELYKKQNGKCFWFGVDLVPSSKKKYPFQPSIDRIDNKKGYLKNNVVLCCFSANFARNENSFDVFKEFCEELLEGKKTKKEEPKYTDKRFKKVKSPCGKVFNSVKEASLFANISYKKFKQ